MRKEDYFGENFDKYERYTVALTDDELEFVRELYKDQYGYPDLVLAQGVDGTEGYITLADFWGFNADDYEHYYRYHSFLRLLYYKRIYFHSKINLLNIHIFNPLNLLFQQSCKTAGTLFAISEIESCTGGTV